MKVYLIKLDTMPYCKDALKLVDMMKGTLTRQVNGCFTTSTVVPMFTGKLTSDLEPHGMGYNLWRTRRDKKGLVDFSWTKEFIQVYLLNKGYKFVTRNMGNLLEHLGLMKYPEISKNHTTPYDQHDGRSHRYLTSRGPEWERSKKNEFAWIEKAQTASGKKIFHWINYSHYHATVHKERSEHIRKCAIAGRNTLDLMGHYDFSEPNSLFWVFSDHGPWNHPMLDKYPFPYSFYTWNIVRDNTKHPLVFPSKVISCQDFSLYIKSKFESGVSIPSSKDRIFFTEDGRRHHGPKKMTTALACRFKNWEGEFPLQMSYITYSEIDNKFIQRRVIFDKNGFETDIHDFPRVTDKELLGKLIQRFTWIGRS